MLTAQIQAPLSVPFQTQEAHPSRGTTERAQEDGKIAEAIKRVNQVEALGTRNELRFAVERDTGRILIRVVDPVTQETIRQIPSEVVLRVARMFRHFGSQRVWIA